MPLVTREDWRHSGFAQILKATADVGAPLRSKIQLQAIERAINSTRGEPYVLSTFMKDLPKYPLEREVAMQALRFWFDAIGVTPAEVLPTLTTLVLDSLSYGAEHANPEVIAAFLTMLPDGEPADLDRRKTAEVICKSTHSGLQTRLTQMLFGDYTKRGFSSLTAAELNVLAKQPPLWWHEHAIRMTLDPIDAKDLLGWVSRITCQSPDSAWWAALLATEWLSRVNARSVPDFWLELCLLTEGMPAEVRRTVLDALGAPSAA